MSVYVVTAPESIRGIYETWAACEAVVSGVSGAQYQSVPSRERAEQILRGESVTLPSGVYAFVDGNHRGGVGVVFVKQRSDRRVTREISTNVFSVFEGAGVLALKTEECIQQELTRLRNVLAELAGVYQALTHIARETSLTIVYDYEGIGAWLENRWRTKDSTVGEIIETCRRLILSKQLTIAFRHQPGHESTLVSKDEFVFFNQRADRLATEGASP